MDKQPLRRIISRMFCCNSLNKRIRNIKCNWCLSLVFYCISIGRFCHDRPAMYSTNDAIQNGRTEVDGCYFGTMSKIHPTGRKHGSHDRFICLGSSWRNLVVHHIPGRTARDAQNKIIAISEAMPDASLKHVPMR